MQLVFFFIIIHWIYFFSFLILNVFISDSHKFNKNFSFLIAWLSLTFIARQSQNDHLKWHKNFSFKEIKKNFMWKYLLDIYLNVLSELLGGAKIVISHQSVHQSPFILPKTRLSWSDNPKASMQGRRKEKIFKVLISEEWGPAASQF